MGKLTIQSFAVMPFDENCYVVSDDTGEGVVIDPGGMAKEILAYIREAKLSIKAVLDTHGHCDHIGANDAIRDATEAPLYIHKEDGAMISDIRLNLSAFMGFKVISRPAEHLLSEGDKISFGNSELEVIHTPGHTKGGVCFVGDGVAFTGDTLFAGSIGRSDFPGGSEVELIGNIKKKLLALPDETKVYSGHGPSSEIGWERKCNPYLQW
ncbi:MAG: MBL fold metallo-hydrolase [Schwartzia sp.]|jgi:glyoxylase-like metal-dependent hydrolase (beta-lactamase superfamily II)|nr:MBL fold metallo-hydrolase [Schwartzia sp. (in: firmicutes)]MBQ9633772.1 MBL fold metallo-hydrolase [Schwartzia sp. (in: firmicutes)]